MPTGKRGRYKKRKTAERGDLSPSKLSSIDALVDWCREKSRLKDPGAKEIACRGLRSILTAQARLEEDIAAGEVTADVNRAVVGLSGHLRKQLQFLGLETLGDPDDEGKPAWMS